MPQWFANNRDKIAQRFEITKLLKSQKTMGLHHETQEQGQRRPTTLKRIRVEAKDENQKSPTNRATPKNLQLQITKRSRHSRPQTSPKEGQRLVQIPRTVGRRGRGHAQSGKTPGASSTLTNRTWVEQKLVGSITQSDPAQR
jgi:hypothetical protein